MSAAATPREQATEAFRRLIGHEPDFIVQAPGRVNLIGEHTDYNDGFVLPCAIDFHTIIACGRRSDGIARSFALDFNEASDQFALGEPIAHLEGDSWPNYVRGVVQSLAKRGVTLQGLDMVICGNVPPGAGLSSSAALEVAVGEAFREGSGLQSALTPTDLAKIGQQAENEFVGCQCGIMDQLISARGEAGRALLIDCRSLEARPVHVPDSLAVMIIHSNVKRQLVGSEYNTRRTQCEEAAAHFAVKALRDLSLEQLEAGRTRLDPLVYRRARHVVTENARTEAAAVALEAGDIVALSRLMAASHASMRDDFQITVPPIDALVALIAKELGEAGGVRMTGGGFGGCVVALVPHADIDRVRQAIERDYPARTGLKATVWICAPSAGSRVL